MILGDTPLGELNSPFSPPRDCEVSLGVGPPGLTFWSPLVWDAQRLLNMKLGPWRGGWGRGTELYTVPGLPAVRICGRPCGVSSEPKKRDNSHLVVLLPQMVL